ncbi:glyoxylate/hydroxypyruvate reductase GhrA [Yersinia ruckeri]|uniref:glyoxylate/hydroxypyruvate reductase GhrA n=1 Tax=Yersinia ruckeri TaxID=29486 RepID=UPI0020BE39DE|nr:glyoxylate/hydroxypyruvate reductase GhrA [Yersinia ruckeri]MCK8564617.1 glyoxylate/hydroxypyruvate reductase GhrA [Yersinia ruckeri]UZY19693.1 glyoxylate/hydroxypyruvate reductase GhrA [Yersinia ruckeri]
MNIIFHHPFVEAQQWLNGMQSRLPKATIRQWQRGDNKPADYAMVWLPPHEMLVNRQQLKGIFVLGAGVDAILDQERRHPGTLPAGVPLIRLEDTGMALQMQEYAVSSTLRYFRRMDEYQLQQEQKLWQPLTPHQHDQFVVGVMGAGVLGQSVARKLSEFGFKVRSWSRTAKQISGVESFAGNKALPDFLRGTQLLINLLPSTPETIGILSDSLFSQLNKQAYLINLARGAHLLEKDLLAAMKTGQIAAAMLDVFAEEPLPSMHPFWTHPRITLTPHIAAVTLPEVAMDQVAENIKSMEADRSPVGRVDVARGY